MVAPRRRNLIARRRRRSHDDGEDEGSVAEGVDDSLSEGSLPSDVEEDADADVEGSETSEAGKTRRSNNGVVKKAEQENGTKATNGHAPEQQQSQQPQPQPQTTSKLPSFNASVADTDAMMNGMKIDDAAGDGAELNFEEATEQQVDHDQEALATTTATPGVAQGVPDANVSESFAERRRREHEMYKKKRDEDPTFIPNRGGFFMHDHRTYAPGPNGFRTSGRGRGRGRGGLERGNYTSVP